jgi:hypothetical protein
MEQLTPKQLKNKVSAECALDPSLADRITKMVGFEPRWSEMSVEQLYNIQKSWELITFRNGEDE